MYKQHTTGLLCSNYVHLNGTNPKGISMLNHAYGSLECEEGDTRKRGISRENIGLGAFCSLHFLSSRCVSTVKQPKSRCGLNPNTEGKVSHRGVLSSVKTRPQQQYCKHVVLYSRGVHGIGEDWDPMGFPWEWE